MAEIAAAASGTSAVSAEDVLPTTPAKSILNNMHAGQARLPVRRVPFDVPPAAIKQPGRILAAAQPNPPATKPGPITAKHSRPPAKQPSPSGKAPNTAASCGAGGQKRAPVVAAKGPSTPTAEKSNPVPRSASASALAPAVHTPPQTLPPTVGPSTPSNSTPVAKKASPGVPSYF